MTNPEKTFALGDPTPTPDPFVKKDDPYIEYKDQIFVPAEFKDQSGNVEVEVDASGRFEYKQTYWDDLRFPLTSTKAAGIRDPDFNKIIDNGSGSDGVFAYAFDSSVEEELFFVGELPHLYKEGTDIRPHIHWCPNSSGVGSTRWGLEYTWSNNDEDISNTNIIYASGTETTSLSHEKNYFPNINGSGKKISSLIIGRIFRDSTSVLDTYDQDAFALDIDFHYQIDSPGSNEVLIKR